MRKFCMITCILVIVLLTGCNLIPLVNTPPVANFICQTQNPVVNVPVAFSASGSNDAEDGQNLAARWDFNADNVWDLDYSHGKKVTDAVTYTYTAAGTYTVKLEVRDSRNAAHTVTQTVVVTANQQSLSPTAVFSYVPTSPLVNQPVTFNPSGSSDPVYADDALLVRWDFDGDQIWEIEYSAGKKVTDLVNYTYSTPGTYDVTLEVKDLGGATATLTQSIQVSDLPADAGMIQGYLVESRGGSGIGEVHLSLHKDSQVMNLLTESDGSFQIYIEPGLYQLIFTKDGYASSKVQDLYVKANQMIQLDIPLMEKFSELWPTNGPLITIQDLPQSNEGAPLSGGYTFTVQVTAGIGVKRIEVRLNNEKLEPEFSFTDSSTAEVQFDTSLLMDGWNYLKISTYDANNNYTEMYKPVYVVNNLPTVQPASPILESVTAMTFGESLQIMGHPSEVLMKICHEKGFDLQRGLDAAKEENSTVVVLLKWNDVPGAIGYKVYRSFDNESNYTCIGNAYNTIEFTDTSAMLMPGRMVYYQISAFNGTKESLPGSSAYTIPLETFRVSLVSPEQDQIVTVQNPVFTWNYNRLVGDYQTYVIQVQGVTDGTPCMEDDVSGVTSITYSGQPLQSGKEYEWDIVQAVAEKEYSQIGYALSVSGDDRSSINGFYRFITNF